MAWMQRSMNLAAEKGASNWLTCRPLKHHGLNRSRYTTARFEMLSASATGGLRPTSQRAVSVELPLLSRTPCLAQ